MTTMTSLATTTNLNMSMSTGMGAGVYVRPRVSGFSRHVGVDANTRRTEVTAAVAAVRRASEAQARIDNIKGNDKK